MYLFCKNLLCINSVIFLCILNVYDLNLWSILGLRNAGSICKCRHCYFEYFSEFDEIYNWTREPCGVVDATAKDGDEEGASGCRRVGAGCLCRAAQHQVQEVELSSRKRWPGVVPFSKGGILWRRIPTKHFII